MATKKTASAEEAKKTTTKKSTTTKKTTSKKSTTATKKAPANKKTVGSSVVKEAADKIEDSSNKSSENVFDKFEDQEKVTLYKENVNTVQGLYNIFGNPDATMEVPKAAVEMYNEGKNGGKITLMNISIDKDNVTAKVGDKSTKLDINNLKTVTRKNQ